MSVFIGYPSFMAYQMMKGKKGNNDGFPSIPGMIARYSALGLTNEQMTANPVWKDLTGNGHDLQMKNFACGGMSGVGGYTESFLGDKINWESEIYNSRKMSVFEGNRSKVSIIHNQYHFQTYVKISGIDDNEGKVRGVYFYNMESSFTEGTICRTDGIYKIDITELNERGVVGIWAYPAKKNEEVYDYPVTIEILPLYPGALVFDGVDDYGTCDNFPILTKEKGYTVVALRQYLVEKSTAYLTANGDSVSNTSFIFEGNNYKDTWNFGRATTIQASRILATQTSKQYDGVKLNIGTNAEGSNLLQVGKWSKSYSNVAIWELVFLDHDATEEELTKIKDYFVKTYPWLFPDQAWTVTGKTNEDEDRATIANITGNGNDLVLSNFAFSGNSGYGEYAYNFNDTSWISIPDYGVISDKTSKSFNIKSFVLADYPVLYTAVNKDSSIKKVKIKVTNSIPGFYFGNKPANQIIDLSTDGIYEIPSYNSPNDVTQYGFRCSNVNDSCNITIEQIPEYEGYLVTDGVDDKITSSAFKMGKDWTVVGDWKFINDESKNAGIIKPSSLYVYNALNGVSIFINSGSIGNNIKENKGFNAICSNGRAYDRNWTEYSELKVEEVTKSNSELKIGASSNDTTYTRMAFKNFAIYPKVLSKDDCIKAYNYLQTLKAK